MRASKRHQLLASGLLATSLGLLATTIVARGTPRPAVTGAATVSAAGAAHVTHVIEIMLENHTFDDLFGHFPGAKGMPARKSFPNPAEYFTSMAEVPALLAPPNEGDVYGGINNSRAAEKMAMDYTPGRGYLMDGYTLFPSDGLSSITQFGPRFDPDLQYLAHHYELADMNFQPAIAPTQPNVDYAVAGTANAWMYNNTPPPAENRWHSIFDELSHAHRSWRIYYGIPPSLLVGSVWEKLVPAGSSNIAPVSRFFSDIGHGQLPSFSFVRPGVGYSEEPPEDISQGDAWLGQLVAAVAKSQYWRSTVIFVTYDEGGGFYDHVAPPLKTPYGYGTRTPMVIISPWVRGGVFDSQTTNISILSFMQHLWALAPLTRLNSEQNDLAGAFDFYRRPLPPPRLPVNPHDTIGFYGVNTLTDVSPLRAGSRATIHLQVNTPGLVLDASVSGIVHLTCIPPSGTALPRGLPRLLTFSDGRTSFEASFPRPGYYRLKAQGPGVSVGWVTIDVGTGPNTK
ncbi:MAG: alkaline phosphatase family protein [Acidimicrobiales bacterium]